MAVLKKSEVETVTLEELKKDGEEILPFVRPTRRIHDSGFRCFQVGYCSRDGKRETILGEYTDHLNINKDELGYSLNIDFDTAGRIRFFRDMEWGIVVSSAYLVKKKTV